ncbi:alpha/beta hydrolase family protein [mine drainage metagenome]|uniref:Alpha/beta hydrolase family protein n=1 Tax=mine drainage metagenome TaxID=410659 RepID=A0A1J5THX8_9ZZZZ
MRNLKQRIAIKYYKTKLNTIALVSPRLAAEKALDLFCTPFGKRNKLHAPPVFHHAEKLSFELKDSIIINGWRWKSDRSDAKKILIAHGFNSNSYKFEKYVLHLQTEGFEVLAFDAPAHGMSEGKRVNALLYRDMILEIEKKYGQLFGIMAHSLGGLSAALAAEKIKTLEKLVLIAPATETYRAVDNFFTLIQLNHSFKKEFEEVLMEFAGYPISYFSVSRAITNITANTLWLHDTEDFTCSFEDVLPVQKMNLPSLQFYITNGLGHSRIYKENKVIKAIVSFFALV